MWDKDKNGFIDKEELLAPGNYAQGRERVRVRVKVRVRYLGLGLGLGLNEGGLSTAILIVTLIADRLHDDPCPGGLLAYVREVFGAVQERGAIPNIRADKATTTRSSQSTFYCHTHEGVAVKSVRAGKRSLEAIAFTKLCN